MSKDQQVIVKAFCDAANRIKRTGFTPDMVDPEWYLGGDFGIDSIEMLEIWIEIGEKLKLKIGDQHKRDVYTLNDVLNVVKTAS